MLHNTNENWLASSVFFIIQKYDTKSPSLLILLAVGVAGLLDSLKRALRVGVEGLKLEWSFIQFEKLDSVQLIKGKGDRTYSNFWTNWTREELNLNWNNETLFRNCFISIIYISRFDNFGVFYQCPMSKLGKFLMPNFGNL